MKSIYIYGFICLLLVAAMSRRNTTIPVAFTCILLMASCEKEDPFERPEKGPVTETTYRMDNLESDKVYYWKICAGSDEGFQTVSSIHRFVSGD